MFLNILQIFHRFIFLHSQLRNSLHESYIGEVFKYVLQHYNYEKLIFMLLVCVVITNTFSCYFLGMNYILTL